MVSKCRTWHNYFLSTFSCPANEHIFTILQRQFFHSAQKSYLVVACRLWCLKSQVQDIFCLSECVCVCWRCSYFRWWSFSREKKMRLEATIKIISLIFLEVKWNISMTKFYFIWGTKNWLLKIFDFVLIIIVFF